MRCMVKRSHCPPALNAHAIHAPWQGDQSGRRMNLLTPILVTQPDLDHCIVHTGRWIRRHQHQPHSPHFLTHRPQCPFSFPPIFLIPAPRVPTPVPL